MRVSRSFSFDKDLDKELLEFLDGCRNASDSVRGILRNALGLKDEQVALKELAVHKEMAISAVSEKQTEIKTPNTLDIQKIHAIGKVTGFENVLAAMSKK